MLDAPAPVVGSPHDATRGPDHRRLGLRRGCRPQADLKAFAAHGSLAPLRSRGHRPEHDGRPRRGGHGPFVRGRPIDAVLTDLSVAAVKTGMLATPRPLRRSPRSHGTVLPQPGGRPGARVIDRPSAARRRRGGGLSRASHPRAPCSRPTFAKRPCSAGSMSHPLTARPMAACRRTAACPRATWVVVKGGHLSRLEHAENDDALRSSPTWSPGRGGSRPAGDTGAHGQRPRYGLLTLGVDRRRARARRDPLSAIEEAKAYVGVRSSALPGGGSERVTARSTTSAGRRRPTPSGAAHRRSAGAPPAPRCGPPEHRRLGAMAQSPTPWPTRRPFTVPPVAAAEELLAAAGLLGLRPRSGHALIFGY